MDRKMRQKAAQIFSSSLVSGSPSSGDRTIVPLAGKAREQRGGPERQQAESFSEGTSKIVPSLSSFPHKQAQECPRKTRPEWLLEAMPSCTAILAPGGADSRARRAEEEQAVARKAGASQGYRRDGCRPKEECPR